MPLKPHQLTAAVTPTPDVFVLAHLGVPRVDAAAWSLEIDGLVHRPRSFTLAGLRRFPRREVLSFHECSGHPLTPWVPTRRVANVVWGGVDLRVLLEEVGVDPAARYLWSYGLDRGVFEGMPSDWYLKDLPLGRVAAGDVLVAYELNGEPLSAEHGFPARLFIPGWYGTNSVKWLQRMTLATGRAEGLFTTELYNDAVSPPGASPVRTRPVWEIAPEAVIVAPAPKAQLQVGALVEVWGWAWAPAGVRSVEISLDNGRTWQATTISPRQQLSWQRFSYQWLPTRPEGVTLQCRATDLTGERQPLSRARNQVHAVRVQVEALRPRAQAHRANPSR